MTAPDYNPVVLERTMSFMALTVVFMLLLQKSQKGSPDPQSPLTEASSVKFKPNKVSMLEQ